MTVSALVSGAFKEVSVTYRLKRVDYTLVSYVEGFACGSHAVRMAW